MKKGIGLIGFGCVGRGFYDLLREKNFSEAELKVIAVKNRKKQRDAPKELFVYDAFDVVDHDEVQIVVEAIDDATMAFEIAKRALHLGKHVISANKKMVAQNLEELLSLQRKTGAILLYEAAVCGAIPVVKKIDELFHYERISIIRGIFNGTSNYVLTRLNSGRLNYEGALKKAQELGFAEADPVNDVSGKDALYKSVILAQHAFGITLNENDVLCIGIENITGWDIQFARAKGKRIRLVPHLIAETGRVGAFVLPQFVDTGDKLYHVDEEFNALLVESDFAGEQLYYGKGAGSYPTAFSLFTDLLEILQRRSYRDHSESKRLLPLLHNDIVLEIYLRFRNPEIRNMIDDAVVLEGLIDESYQIVVARLSIAQIKNIQSAISKDQGVIALHSQYSRRLQGNDLNYADVFRKDKREFFTSLNNAERAQAG